MNISMDYVWLCRDKTWQEDYGKRFQNFLHSKGLETYDDDFVNAIWNTRPEPYEDGYFDPYNGLMYLFNMIYLRGRYQVIKPQTN